LSNHLQGIIGQALLQIDLTHYIKYNYGMFRSFFVIYLVLLAQFAYPQQHNFKYLFLPAAGKRISTAFCDINGDNLTDIVNLCVNLDAEPVEKWLQIFIQNKDGTYSRIHNYCLWLRPEISAVMVANLVKGNGSEVCFFARDGVYYFPFKGGKFYKPRKIIHTATFFPDVESQRLYLWEGVADLDENGFDDFVLPTDDGYKVYFQTEEGLFGKIVKLSNAPFRTFGAHPVEGYAEESIITPATFVFNKAILKAFITDINGDDLKDIALLCHDKIVSFIQNEDRSFRRKIYEMLILRQSIRKGEVKVDLINFVDINGDDCCDLVKTRLEATLGVLESIKTVILIYPGNGDGTFRCRPLPPVEINGVSINPVFIDLDKDGAKDVIISRVRTDLVNPDPLLLKELTFTYGVFRFDKIKQRFAVQPGSIRDIHVSLKDVHRYGLGSVPLMYFEGDFNGDGVIDSLTIDPSRKVVEIRRGRTKIEGDMTLPLVPIGIEKTVYRRFKIPRAPKKAKIIYLNRDVIADVALLYSSGIGLFVSLKR
jgi:hypothetical protein